MHFILIKGSYQQIYMCSNSDIKQQKKKTTSKYIGREGGILAVYCPSFISQKEEIMRLYSIKITVGILVKSYDLHIKELNRPVSSPMPLAI